MFFMLTKNIIFAGYKNILGVYETSTILASFYTTLLLKQRISSVQFPIDRLILNNFKERIVPCKVNE